ncbi:MAG: superoxide dismutase [Myxococcota bacterium]
MSIELTSLPWAPDALQPYLSEEAISYHHGKHHRGYVDKVNAMIAGTEMDNQTLKQIITATAGSAEHRALYNNAAQVWNHTFFWNSIKPRGGIPPRPPLQGKVVASFGTYEDFKREFTERATGLFGSGWVWLVLAKGRIEILQTPDAQCPITMDVVPLLTLDVWEHAYYVDYRNRRADFVKAFLDRLINWEFAASNLAKATEQQKGASPATEAVSEGGPQ